MFSCVTDSRTWSGEEDVNQVLQMLTIEGMCNAVLKYEEKRERVEQQKLMFFKRTWLFSRVREYDSGSCNEE